MSYKNHTLTQGISAQDIIDQEVTGAVVDMGSNTFHLVIANIRAPVITVIDRIREPVRLAAGFDEKGCLTPEVIERSLECLGRFAERLQHMPAAHVRAVGTNALRKAHNRSDFLAAAQQALGRPIEIVSGHDEGRLIYAGVYNRFEFLSEQRLVIDIGGGSTELVIGRGSEIQAVESFDVGSLTVTLNFFPKGRVTGSSMRAAILAVEHAIEPFIATLHKSSWEVIVGSSGSIMAIAEVLRQKGWAKSGITYAGLKKLHDFLIDSGCSSPAEFPYLNPDRAWVFAGGVAILIAMFKKLAIEHLLATEGGIREGILLGIARQAQYLNVGYSTIK